jgi:O-antigen ligase
MSGARARYQGGVWRIGLVLTAAMVAGGGMGASTSAAVMGLMLGPFFAAPAARFALSEPLAPTLFAAAIAWTAASLAWSPYDRPDQAIKLMLLTPLFLTVVVAAARMNAADAERRLVWLLVPIVIVAAYLLIEAALDAPIARWVKVSLEGYDPPASAFADRLLGRAVSAFLMLAGPAAIALWTHGRPAARIGAGLVTLAGLAGASGFKIDANLAALLLAVGAAGLAWRFGGRALGGLCFFAAATIIAAPLYMSALLALISEDAAAGLPLSWHMRLEIWRYALDQVAAAPVFGHGLDASRVLGEPATLRGTPFDLLPLHAHNAGLHIWLETGFMGAALYGAALAALGWRLMTAGLQPFSAAAAAFTGTCFLVTVLVGSGVWQEWLHGSLAIGLAAALMIRR